MKIKNSLQLFFFIVTSTFTCALAEESPEEAVKRMAQMGPGVHDVRKDATGALQSLKVVGQERIPKALGPAKGIMFAQKRASMRADAEFVEWMKKNINSVSSSGDETIVTLSGDGENLSEGAKNDGKDTAQITREAQGLVKGLKLVGKDQDPDTGLLTLVYSWSPSGAQLANEAKQANNRPTEPSAKPTQEESGKPSQEIQKKTVVSPDFDE